jgi:two-component system chemotaxis response regulator CheB
VKILSGFALGAVALLSALSVFIIRSIPRPFQAVISGLTDASQNLHSTMLTDALAGEPDIEVVGSAPDRFIARDKILALEPDILTLDIEMPRMDGLSFLRRLMAHRPMPVIIVSSLAQAGSSASLEALQAGAIDVIPKPGGPYSVGQVIDKLKERIRVLLSGPALRYQKPAVVNAPPAPSLLQRTYRGNALIVIGASTGGTQAIEGLLTRMPADVPPIVIVQHMPASFTKLFAERLDGICPMHVVESQGGEVLQRGTVYIAPGDYHLLLERQGVQLKTLLRQGPWFATSVLPSMCCSTLWRSFRAFR